MSGNPYTLFVLELCKHCGESSPSSSQVGTHPMREVDPASPVVRDQPLAHLVLLGLVSLWCKPGAGVKCTKIYQYSIIIYPSMAR